MLTRADVEKHQEGATPHVESEPDGAIRKLADDIAGICAGVLGIPIRVRFYKAAEPGETRSTFKASPEWDGFTGADTAPNVWINKDAATASELPRLIGHEARHRWQNDTAEGRAEHGDSEQWFREGDANKFASTIADALRGGRAVHFHKDVDPAFANNSLWGKGIRLGDLVSIGDGHLYQNEADLSDVRLKRIV
jgi:hypothetical protein